MFDPAGTLGAQEEAMRRMLASIRHRGPDQFGIFLDAHVALGNARLSIVDLASGQQPISNEDGTLWIVFNGEIFNHVELRAELEARGHRFATHCDTEVIVHLFEDLGPACLEKLNGQFAIAIWNTRRRELFLARDRVGVRPLFFTRHDGRLLFGSEIKALFSGDAVPRELDAESLRQVFVYWGPLPGRTVFRGVSELQPGHYMTVDAEGMTLRRYWAPRFPTAAEGAADRRSAEVLLEEFEALLKDALRIRLRADVPVGAYLSGGLDSSMIAALIRHANSSPLDTFSIAFDDANFDESGFQQVMARFLGTQHQVVQATHADIGRVFPDVIWHTEVPIMRTSPVPMFLLSRLVRDRGYKVVLTGEGADEFLAGYDIFKEAKVRRFWARRPDSSFRHALIGKLYPDVFAANPSSRAFLKAFFGDGLSEVHSPEYSHAIRWKNNRRTLRFFADEGGSASPVPALLPMDFAGWDPLNQAQFLEIEIFLSQYLLSSQGDRVSMAHSVEGRFPFLDVRVVEFCNRLPVRMKLRGLDEKHLLRRLAKRYIPPEIWQRTKRPYRAPIHKSFFNEARLGYVHDVLAPEAVRRAGIFKEAAVGKLVEKMSTARGAGETDEMALSGVLSTQLLHHQFVERFRPGAPLGEKDDVKVVRGPGGW